MIYAEGVNGNFLPHEILDRNCPSILHPAIKVLVVSGVMMKLHSFIMKRLSIEAYPSDRLCLSLWYAFIILIRRGLWDAGGLVYVWVFFT